MNFGFLTDQDATRYCFLRLRRLKQAIKDTKILDALVHELEIPGDSVSGLSTSSKMAAIERRIEQLRSTKTSIWFGVPAPEVLAASIFRAQDLADEVAPTLFSAARRHDDLAAPIIGWLFGSGLTPHRAIPLGTETVDIVGYRKGNFASGPRMIGIAVKNELDELEHALEQMTAFREYTNAMYLACAPAMAAEYVAAHAAAPGVHHWDAELLRRRLQTAGCGLLLVEEDAVSQALLPKERPVDSMKAEVIAAAMRMKSAPRA